MTTPGRIVVDVLSDSLLVEDDNFYHAILRSSPYGVGCLRLHVIPDHNLLQIPIWTAHVLLCAACCLYCFWHSLEVTSLLSLKATNVDLRCFLKVGPLVGYGQDVCSILFTGNITDLDDTSCNCFSYLMIGIALCFFFGMLDGNDVLSTTLLLSHKTWLVPSTGMPSILEFHDELYSNPQCY